MLLVSADYICTQKHRDLTDIGYQEQIRDSLNYFLVLKHSCDHNQLWLYNGNIQGKFVAAPDIFLFISLRLAGNYRKHLIQKMSDSF